MNMLPKILLSVGLSLSVATLSAQTGIAVPQMSSTDAALSTFMQQNNVPGGTFAYARNGKLVYARSFGTMGAAGTESTQPYHMYRIASVSKPITSIAIMKLVQEGLLSLSEKAFGPTGILNQAYYGTPVDNRVNNITVQQLLEHTGGWNRNVSGDPMFQPIAIANALGIPAPAPDSAIIKYMLTQNLNFTPGTQSQYSNFGYNILGRIIEKKTGMEYETYVKTAILEPLGIYDMHIGKNLLEDKFEREGEYVDYPGAPLANSCYADGQLVPWPYGGFNVEAMDAHGAWIATARDLVRLLVAVDGFSTKPDILSSATIQTMVTPSSLDQYYAKGWSVNPFNNWWHLGSLPGTTSLWVRTSGGMTWAAILNTRPGSGDLGGPLDNVMWSAISGVSQWPTHDLFSSPQQGPGNLSFFDVHDTSAVVTFTPGDGANRLVIAREGAPVNRFPLDGQDYTGSNVFGSGQNLGDGNFVLYNGPATAFPLVNLQPGTSYHLRVFDYNKNTTTGNNSLYLLGRSAIGNFKTLGASAIGETDFQQLNIYPNPADNQLFTEWESLRGGTVEIRIQDLSGKTLSRQTHFASPGFNQIHTSIQTLPSGMYLLSLEQEGSRITRKFSRL